MIINGAIFGELDNDQNINDESRFIEQENYNRLNFRFK